MTDDSRLANHAPGPTWGNLEEAMHELYSHQPCPSERCPHILPAVRAVLRAFDQRAEEVVSLLLDAMSMETRANRAIIREADEFTARLTALQTQMVARDFDVNPGER